MSNPPLPSECCVICLESNITYGLRCPRGHFIDNACLNKFLSENVLTKVYELRKRHCGVPCPYPNCNLQLDPIRLYSRLNSHEKSRYLSILCDLMCDTASESNDTIRIVQSAILDSLTLKCPTCFSTIDPLPDACSCVMCLNCGHYYCNFCFTNFALATSKEEESSQAHIHVAEHHPASSSIERSAFLPNEFVLEGHKTFQKKQITKLLSSQLLKLSGNLPANESKENLSSDDELAMNSVKLAILTCARELEDIGIVIEELWALVTNYRSTNDEVVTSDLAVNSASSAVASPITAPNPRGGGPQLTNAIITMNKVAALQLLHAQDLDLDYTDPQSGLPVVALAILSNQPEVALQLLARGANPEVMIRGGRSVLYIVIEFGFVDGLNAILHSHPSLSLDQPITTEASRYFPLHVAATGGNEYMVRRLLSLGVDLEAREMECGFTAAGLAATCGDETIARELVDAGADVRAQNLQNHSVLYCMVEKGFFRTIGSLISKCSILVNEIILEKHGYSLLHVAVLNRQSMLISTLIQKGAEVNARETEHGYSPLYLAVITNDSYNALALLAAGADPCLPSFIGRCPVFDACTNDMMVVVRAIVQKRPQAVEYTGRNDMPLLHLAIHQGRVHLLQDIIALGADVNAKEAEFGTTPLMMALLSENVTAAMMLLENGASPFIPNTQGRPPIYEAITSGLDSVVRALVEKGVDPNSEVEGMPLLHFAIDAGHNHLIPQLVECGADINLKDRKFLTTPLMMAMLKANVTASRILLECGADPNVSNIQGRRPLYEAVSKGMHSLIRILVQKGGQLNTAVDSDGLPLLHLAISEGHTHLIPELIALGADVDVRDGQQHITPLLMALLKGNELAASLLLKAGADPALANLQGRCPIYEAAVKGMFSIIRTLVSKGVDMNAPTEVNGLPLLHLLIVSGHSHLLPSVIELGANVNVVEAEHESTPLIVAVDRNDVVAAKTLLESGADAKICNKHGRSATYVAADEGHCDMLILLVTLGRIDLNDVCNGDEHRRRPLHVAALSNQLLAVKQLLVLGADPALRDGDGRVPADLGSAEIQYTITQCVVRS